MSILNPDFTHIIEERKRAAEANPAKPPGAASVRRTRNKNRLDDALYEKELRAIENI
tara:strand:+ start:630 stop:800 length:171 start_codon:yes stop_codon:yes gene_type:complete